MHSTHDEEKSVFASRFIRTLKKKMYKYMASLSKTMYNDKWADKVKECSNTWHSTIKMTHIEVKLSTYIDVDIEVTDKDPKLEVSDHVRLSRFKNIFAKHCIPR